MASPLDVSSLYEIDDSDDAAGEDPIDGEPWDPEATPTLDTEGFETIEGDTLDAALFYASRGLRVIPLHAAIDGVCTCRLGERCGAKNAGKHPRLSGWPEEATTDTSTLRRWWGKWRTCNVGLPMGGEARLVALDIDGAEGRASLAALESEHGALPRTLTSRSGREDGGEHRLFTVPARLDASAIKNAAGRSKNGRGVAPGIDVRSEGGQIAVAPSVHSSGGVYRWIDASPPAELPEWLYRMMAGEGVDPPASATPRERDAPSPRSSLSAESWPRRYARLVLEKACDELRQTPRGSRNNAANREAYGVAGYLWTGAFGAEEIVDALTSAMRAGGWDPMAEERHVASIRGAIAAGEAERREVPKAKETRPAERKATAKAPAVVTTAPPLDEIEASPAPSFERGDHVELADAVLRKLGPHPLTFDAGEFWRYGPSRGVWEIIPSPKVRTEVASFAGAPVGDSCKPLKVNAPSAVGAEAVARDRLISDPRRVTFEGAPPGVVFSNGFVTVHDGAIAVLPLAPDHRARHGFEFTFEAWEPSATPLFNAFLDELFADCSEDERAARIALLQEFAGACLIGDAIRYQKCLLLFGPGGNGKSSLLTLLRAMFPPDALASVAPQKWSERFSLAALEGKRANLVSETPTGEILDGSAFKAVITGDSVTAERKHKDPFDFRPVAGHIFSLNWPLITADHSEGFWRRPIILPLTRDFENDPFRKLGAEQEVISAELPGVVAWAIEGARRAQTSGRYTMPSQSIELASEWRDASDQVRLFLRQRPADETTIKAGVFFDQYREWARENGHAILSSVKFGLRVVASSLYDRKEDRTGRFYVRR